MLKKIIIGLVLLAALGLGGLSFYVSTIDWNQHKAKIASQIEGLTGKKVVFEGSVSLSFLPHPYLTAENIKIYNTKGENSSEPLAYIKEMVTDLALIPLLQGKFEIDNMRLSDSQIVIKFLPDGSLNWYSKISDVQRDTLDNVEVALNSVMLKNATVNIINPGFDLNVTLENLNAEVTAQTLFGPYRIDGNFVKDNNPAGFALNLGTLSESFGTSLNLVLTHPTTESYARFDGKMLSGNDEVVGNFTVESKNPANFINDLTNQVILPTEFNYPLSSSVELKMNQKQIDLSSFVVKYGDSTAGAGNMLIPLKSENKNSRTKSATDNSRKKIEFSFEMTDLDLQPVIGALKEQIKKYDHNAQPYKPYFDFDLIADVRAVKAYYKDGTIRNLNFSLDLINDTFSIKKLSALYPGDTDISVQGEIFENDEVLNYDFNVAATSQDFYSFLTWLDLKPQTYAPSTYRGAQADFSLSGSLNQIKISPLKLVVDNNVLSGILGVVRDQKNQYFIALQSEKINFDNYLPQFSEEEQKLSLSEKIKLLAKKSDFLNQYDFHFETKLDMGIYHKTPFENLSVKMDNTNGILNISEFKVSQIADSTLDVTGKISGFGDLPTFENLKYHFNFENFPAFQSKFELPLPTWPLFANARKIKANGIVTGNLENANVKAVTSIDAPFFQSVYTGKLSNENDLFNFKGKLEFNTEYVRFINSLGFDYKPKDLLNSIFTFKGDVEGDTENWAVSDMNAFISSNNFTGDFAVKTKNNPRPIIEANIETNRFEFDRLIYNPGRSSVPPLSRSEKQAALFNRPLLSQTSIDYNLYKTFDLNAKVSAKVMNYELEELNDASAQIVISGGKIKVSDFKAVKQLDYQKNAPIEADFEIDINTDPKIKGSASISNYELDRLGGEKYWLKDGQAKIMVDFDAPAYSEAAFVQNLTGKMFFDIENTTLHGWNLPEIERDLSSRDTSERLQEFVAGNLDSGQTHFDLINGELIFKSGNYNFSNIEFSNAEEHVTAEGSGNLKNWDTDSKFTLIFDALKERVEPIEFTWRGALTNPALLVNVSALKNKYDTHWEQIAKDKQAAENARIKALTDEMDKTQVQVKTLSDVVNQNILPLIEEYKPLSSDAEIKSIYDSNHFQVNDINNNLELMEQKAKEEYSHDEIEEMNAKLQVYAPQLREIEQRLIQNIKRDTKVHAAEAYKQILNIYNNSKVKSETYQKSLDSYVERLIQLNSVIVIDRDPKALDYKNTIETSLSTMEDFNKEAGKLRDILEKSDDRDEIELRFKMMKDLRDKSENELEKININMDSLIKYAQQLILDEEDNLAQRGRVIERPVEKVVEEKPQEPEPDMREEETDVMQAEEPEAQKPLLKPLQSQTGDVVTYSSKKSASGTVAKASTRINQTSGTKDATSGLLKPIGGSGVVSTGSISLKGKKAQ